MRRNCRLFHRISFASRPHLALSANAAACILAGRRRNCARTSSGSISPARHSRCGKLGMWRKGRRFPLREPGIYRPRRSRHPCKGHATIMRATATRATATRAMATRATVTRRPPDALAVHTPSAAPASAKCMTSESGHRCVPSASEHAGASGTSAAPVPRAPARTQGPSGASATPVSRAPLPRIPRSAPLPRVPPLRPDAAPCPERRPSCPEHRPASRAPTRPRRHAPVRID